MTTGTQVEFGRMTLPEQVRHFETEGYVILPEVLSPDLIASIKAELADLPMRPSFYSPEPTFASRPPHLHSRLLAELIAHPPTVAFIEGLLGSEVTFIHSHYIVSHPGQPALELHSDYAPYGSTYSGWTESCPVRVRVLYYLDDTGTDRAPLRILPRSHISFHGDAHPYRRYKSHPDEVVQPMRAGDAFAFAVRMFHGTGPNTSERSRGMLEYDYRPVWSRPVQPVEEWEPEQIVNAPEAARRFLRGRNAFDGRWEFLSFQTIDIEAPGLSPHRWDR